MIRRPPRSTLSSSSAASDVYKRQGGRFVKSGQRHVLPAANRDPGHQVLHTARGCESVSCRIPPRRDPTTDALTPARGMQYLVAGVAVGRGEQVALPGLDETPADPRS